MSFYDLDPGVQQQASAKRLLRYLRNDVASYHPFLRKLYRESGVDPRGIRTMDDFRRLPIVEKEHLQSDPLMFIMRAKSPGSPPLPEGFDCEPLRKSTLFRYGVKGAMRLPRDPVYLVRRSTLRERMRRLGLLEWLPIHTHVSTGSSGTPTPVTFTHYDIQEIVRELASLAIQAKNPRPGYVPFSWDERKMSLFPGAPHVAFYAPVLAKFTVGSPSFETFGGQVIPTDKQIALFVNGGFQTLLAIPSYFVHWLRRAIGLQKEGQVGPLKKLRRVILGAEPVSEPFREYLRNLAIEAGADPNVKIMQCAGMTEMKWTFFECAEGSGIHLNPRYYYWEVLHPETRQPVGEREPGVLVFTHVGWRGTVLVRYWTGDLIKGGMVWDRCQMCGWTFPRIFPPICRAQQDFTKIKGTRVDLSLLVETVRDTPGVRNFQISLENEDGLEFARDRLAVTLHPEPGANQEEIRTQLANRMKRYTELCPDHVVFEPDERSMDSMLFAKGGIKAEYIVERRLSRQ